jgi:hypothetical protein
VVVPKMLQVPVIPDDNERHIRNNNIPSCSWQDEAQ